MMATRPEVSVDAARATCFAPLLERCNGPLFIRRRAPAAGKWASVVLLPSR
jgi:hypothetical protein